jgi:hypothetical protein
MFYGLKMIKFHKTGETWKLQYLCKQKYRVTPANSFVKPNKTFNLIEILV